MKIISMLQSDNNERLVCQDDWCLTHLVPFLAYGMSLIKCLADSVISTWNNYIVAFIFFDQQQKYWDLLIIGVKFSKTKQIITEIMFPLLGSQSLLHSVPLWGSLTLPHSVFKVIPKMFEKPWFKQSNHAEGWFSN